MIDKINKKITPVPPEEILEEIRVFIGNSKETVTPLNSKAFAAEQIDEKSNMTTTILTISTIDRSLIATAEIDGSFSLPEASEWTLTLVRKEPTITVLGTA